MTALKDIVKQSGAAYGIAYGADEDEKPTEIHLYAREDAAEALTPLLKAFEDWWIDPANDGKTLGFALGARDD